MIYSSISFPFKSTKQLISPNLYFLTLKYKDQIQTTPQEYKQTGIITITIITISRNLPEETEQYSG